LARTRKALDAREEAEKDCKLSWKIEEVGVLNVQKVGKESLCLNTMRYEVLSK
jgi:hypothetical protein